MLTPAITKNTCVKFTKELPYIDAEHIAPSVIPASRAINNVAMALPALTPFATSTAQANRAGELIPEAMPQKIAAT